ncbi:MAG: hypothetical protein WC223_12530 [Bacteroidales bacterium]|jgi:hypothetical protein
MAKWQINPDINFYELRYFSPVGNDITGDGSKTNPYRTINKAVTELNNYTGSKRRAAVGCEQKITNQTISVVRNGSLPIDFIGEGKLIFDGSQTNYIQSNVAGDGFYNINVVNYENKYLISIYNYSGVTNVIDKCFFESGMYGSWYGGNAQWAGCHVTISNSVIKNFSFDCSFRQGGIICYNSYFFNTTLSYNYYTIAAYNNIIESSVNFRLTSGNLQGTLDFNNIIGSITWEGTQRDLTWLQANTPYNQHSISANAKFNKSAVNDYTLKSDSPCLFAGKNASHIGPFGIGYYDSPVDLWNNRDLSETFNLSMINNKVILTNSGEKEGRYVETIKDFGRVIKMKAAHLAAEFEYDSNGEPVKLITSELQNYPAYNPDNTYYDGDTCIKDGNKKRCTKTGTIGTPVTINPTPTLTSIGTNITLSSAYSMSAGDRITCSNQTKTIVSGSGTAYVINETFSPDISIATNFTHRNYIQNDWEDAATPENPIQTCFYLKFSKTISDLSNEPWRKILFNEDMKVDINGRGNADDSFDLSANSYIRARYIKRRFDFKDTTTE